MYSCVGVHEISPAYSNAWPASRYSPEVPIYMYTMEANRDRLCWHMQPPRYVLEFNAVLPVIADAGESMVTT